jgi:hypothetical protein
MDTLHNPDSAHADLAQLLPREAFHEVMLILRGALPPPASDRPADWTRRDRAAMAAVVALRPVNAAEGRLAAQFVMADCWAADCLRLAAERHRELEVARRCRAQAISLIRESKSSLKALAKLQGDRQVLDKDAAAAGQAAWMEHGLASVMQPALPPALPPAGAPAGPASRASMAAGVSDFGLGAGKATMNRHQRRETEARRKRDAPDPLVAAP